MREAARRLGAPIMWKPVYAEVEAAVARAANLDKHETITRKHVEACVAFYEAMRQWALHNKMRPTLMIVVAEGRAVQEIRVRILVSSKRGLRARCIVAPHQVSHFRCSVFADQRVLRRFLWPTLAGLRPQTYGTNINPVANGVVRWETPSDILTLGQPQIA